MAHRVLKTAPLLGMAIGLLSACQPGVYSDGTYDPYDNGVYQSDVYVTPAPRRVYRTADGKVFATEAQRRAYLDRAAKARARASYDAGFRRGTLAAEQADRRLKRADRAERRRNRALQQDEAYRRALIREQNEIRRQERVAEQEYLRQRRAERIERDRERALRSERQRRNAERNQGRADQDLQRARRDARRAQRRADRAAAEAERQRQAARKSRRSDRLARQQSGSSTLTPAAQRFRNLRKPTETDAQFNSRVRRAVIAGRETGRSAGAILQESGGSERKGSER